MGHDPYKTMVRDIPSDSNFTRAGEGQGEEEEIFFKGIEPLTTGFLETNYTTEPNIHDVPGSV